MKNDPTGPTAEGMSSISRRKFLRSSAAAVAIGGMTAMTVPAAAVVNTPDPILAFIQRWDAVIADYESVRRSAEEENALWKANIAPMEDRCTRGDIPNATTAEGAAAAIRKALSFNDMEPQDANLVRSALAFLEGKGG